MISAETLREQSEANRKAIEEERFNEMKRQTDSAAKLVRDRVEREIQSAARKGNTGTGRMRVGYSCQYGGFISDAIKALAGRDKHGYSLELALRNGSRRSPGYQYAHDVWVNKAAMLLEELAANGYKVAVESGDPHREQEELPVTPESMLTGYTTVSWGE